MNAIPAARDAIVAQARATAALAKGKRYKTGGKSPEGFDCSGFVWHVLSAVLPDHPYLTTAALAASELFVTVAQPQPGDLILFPPAERAGAKLPGHVGIVIDADSWIGAQSSTGVAVVDMSEAAWWSARDRRFLCLKALA